MAAVKELTNEELIDEYVFAVNNQYPTPKIAEPQRRALADEYNKIQAEKKRKTGLSRIGMSAENYRELQNLNNRAEVIFNFIRESLAFGGLAPESMARTYINQVAALGAAS